MYKFGGEDKKSPVHIVSTWVSQNEIVLGQIKTKEKSNEITAIPELLNFKEFHLLCNFAKI